MPVIESSVAEFVERWRQYAVAVNVYPQPEGSPLIEARVEGRVLYLLDRGGPYGVRPGEVRLIVSPVAETVIAGAGEERLQVTGVSRIEATGTVLEGGANIVVVQAVIPLVLGVFDSSWRQFEKGSTVSFISLEPVHGFPLLT